MVTLFIVSHRLFFVSKHYLKEKCVISDLYLLLRNIHKLQKAYLQMSYKIIWVIDSTHQKLREALSVTDHKLL